MSEVHNRPFVCPYHGRIYNEHVTTIKTCGKCMEELSCSSGDATLLRREPYEEHTPRHQYDCGRCKFAWCCGPQCACGLKKHKCPEASEERKAEVEKAQEMWRRWRRSSQ